MSDNLRRYIIAFCILLTLSVFHFALAAPIAVGEILEVRSKTVDVLKDGMTVWAKRMDPEEEGRNPVGDPDSDVTDVPVGHNEEDMGSDAREPGPHHNNPPEEKSDDSVVVNSDAGYDSVDSVDGGYVADNSDNGGDGHDSGSDSVNSDSVNSDSVDSGYVADAEGHESDGVQSELSAPSVGNMSPRPEPEHPAIPEFMADLEKLFRLRPRNSGSGVVGTPKRELQGTVDIKANVIGGGAVRSVRDLPVYHQNRKKWILDRLD